MQNLRILKMKNNKITKINSNAFSDNKKIYIIDLSENLIKILNLQFIYNLIGLQDFKYFFAFNNNLIEDIVASDNGTFVDNYVSTEFHLALGGNLLSQVVNMKNQ